MQCDVENYALCRFERLTYLYMNMLNEYVVCLILCDFCGSQQQFFDCLCSLIDSSSDDDDSLVVVAKSVILNGQSYVVVPSCLYLFSCLVDTMSASSGLDDDDDDDKDCLNCSVVYCVLSTTVLCSAVITLMSRGHRFF